MDGQAFPRAGGHERESRTQNRLDGLLPMNSYLWSRLSPALDEQLRGSIPFAEFQINFEHVYELLTG